LPTRNFGELELIVVELQNSSAEGLVLGRVQPVGAGKNCHVKAYNFCAPLELEVKGALPADQREIVPALGAIPRH